MTELVERYVRQVGRYLPQKERTEIERELRSLIQDQLDDRYTGVPSVADVASVLAELGEPRQMAASYGSEQYLVGPDLYPNMMMVLRLGWLRIPTLVVCLNVIWALVSSQQGTVLGLFIESMFTALSVTFTFSAVVVLVFAILQHVGIELDTPKTAFNPLDLPAVDDPAAIDHFEVAFSMAFSAFAALVMFYFMRVGGLTLRFNLNDPGEVIVSPTLWMFLFAMTLLAQISLHLLVLRRNGWSVGLWLGFVALDLFLVICGYFAVLEPVYERLRELYPTFRNIGWVPMAVALTSAVLMLVSGGSKLIQLLGYDKHDMASLNTQPHNK